MAEGREPLLLTPGPLTTSAATKRAMLRDWGSRDGAFIAMTRRLRERLTDLAGGRDTHDCVPLQGSGTYAVEAAIGTVVPPGDRLLVLVNGAYGRRIAAIARRLGRGPVELETEEDAPPDPADVAARLDADPAIGHVAIVHCETTSGILNPVEAVAALAAARGRRLIVDAMSSFGALPLDVKRLPADVLVASANKCLEGVPGLAFAILRRDLLAASAGRAPSLSLDLHDQWRALEANGQWRFTPPVQVVAALDQALAEHAAEGGVEGRGARYRRNARILVDGLRRLGLQTLLPDALQAPIIVTVLTPADPAFRFDAFYAELAQRGYLIYPGKLTRRDSFRLGCIGRLGEAEMTGAVEAVAEALVALGVRHPGPSPERRASAPP